MSQIRFNQSSFDWWCNGWFTAQFFVANVNVDANGRKANVNRFSNDNVWNADNCHRVVVPKLIFLPSSWWEFLL